MELTDNVLQVQAKALASLSVLSARPFLAVEADGVQLSVGDGVVSFLKREFGKIGRAVFSNF